MMDRVKSISIDDITKIYKVNIFTNNILLLTKLAFYGWLTLCRC